MLKAGLFNCKKKISDKYNIINTWIYPGLWCDVRNFPASSLPGDARQGGGGEKASAICITWLKPGVNEKDKRSKKTPLPLSTPQSCCAEG